jgi:RNA polymerase sigma-70 factor (ECF subfamily)
MAVKPVDQASDRTLVRRVVRDGDERAFRELYRRHTPRVYAVVLRVLGNEHDAEDVVQDTWLRAVRAAGRFRWEASFSSWLTAIALNSARGVRRRAKRWPSVDLPADTPGRTMWDASDAGLDLARALARVPAGYRSVLTLYDLEGYAHEEIGRRLGIATGTSKSQVHHARRFVRSLLERRPAIAEVRA